MESGEGRTRVSGLFGGLIIIISLFLYVFWQRLSKYPKIVRPFLATEHSMCLAQNKPETEPGDVPGFPSGQDVLCAPRGRLTLSIFAFHC